MNRICDTETSLGSGPCSESEHTSSLHSFHSRSSTPHPPPGKVILHIRSLNFKLLQLVLAFLQLKV